MNWKTFLKYCGVAAVGAAAALGIDWLRRHVYLVLVTDDDDGSEFDDDYDDFDDFDDDDFDDFDESELFADDEDLEDVPDDGPEDGDFSGADSASEKVFRFDGEENEA